MTDTIIIIEYGRGKVEWRPSTVETLSYIASRWGFIESVREVEAGADAPTDADDAAEKLKQAEAVRLKAVKVLVGVDECCGECRDASESESRRRAGGDTTLAVDLASVLADPGTKTVKLRTAAETRTRRGWGALGDGNRYSYGVYLVDEPGGVVLRISDTPGSWYVWSLLDGGLSPETYIDYGQRWLWVNVHEVFDELRQLAGGMGEQ